MGNDSKYQHKNAKEKKTREPKKPGQDITITKLTQKSSMLGPGERNGLEVKNEIINFQY